MDAPINFDNLHALTGQDPALERDLFQLFDDSARDRVQVMSACLADNDQAGWKNAAHALKGISFNLGADSLAQLCARAETISAVTEKQALLEQINAAIEAVRAVLVAEIARMDADHR